MRWGVHVASALAGVCFIAMATSTGRAQQPVPVQVVSPVPQIVATGQGEAKVTPDRARIFIGVEARARTAAAASTENARKQRGIIDTLRAMGIPQEQISTAEFSVYPEQQFNPERGDTMPRIMGYVVRNVVRAELRQIDQVGRVLDAALAKGANQINSLDFYASNAAEVRRSALAQAIQNATANACAMAVAAGGMATGPLELSELGDVRPFLGYGGAMRDVAQAAPTPIAPGEQTLTVTVTARFGFGRGLTAQHAESVCRNR
jgi:uncharacterized protein YggE